MNVVGAFRDVLRVLVIGKDTALSGFTIEALIVPVCTGLVENARRTCLGHESALALSCVMTTSVPPAPYRKHESTSSDPACSCRRRRFGRAYHPVEDLISIVFSDSETERLCLRIRVQRLRRQDPDCSRHRESPASRWLLP